MPIVRISGLPQPLFQPNFSDVLKSIRHDVECSILKITELKLTDENEITVHFLVCSSSGTPDIVADIDISAHPERTKSVCKVLAGNVTKALRKNFLSGVIKSVVKTNNPAFAVWISK